MNDDCAPHKLITRIFLVCLHLAVLPAGVIAQEVSSGELSAEQKMQKAKEYYSAGKQFIQQGNYSAADREFKKAQQLLGSVSAVGTSNAPSMVSSGDQAQSVLPKQVRSPAVLAWEASLKGKSGEAITHYLEAIALEPKNTNLHYNLAVEYLKTRQYKKAAQVFRQVIQLNPKDKNAYYNLGVLYDSYLGDKTQAVVFYNQYIRLADKAEDVRAVKEWIRQIEKEMEKK